MTRTVWAMIGAAMLAMSACGPMEDGGGNEGAPCQQESDCASNGCCGDGNAAVAASQQPICPASCSNGRLPHSPCVNNGSGIVTCDFTGHCSVAPGNPGSCNF